MTIKNKKLKLMNIEDLSADQIEAYWTSLPTLLKKLAEVRANIKNLQQENMLSLQSKKRLLSQLKAIKKDLYTEYASKSKTAELLADTIHERYKVALEVIRSTEDSLLQTLHETEC